MNGQTESTDIFIDLSGSSVIKPKNTVSNDRISVYGILIKDNKILLVKELGAKVWELPGGGIENNEDDVSALKREMLEEAGCKVDKVGKCVEEIKNNFYANDIDKYFYNTGRFYMILEWDFLNKEIEPETEEFKMFDLENICQKDIRPYHWKMIEKMRKDL